MSTREVAPYGSWKSPITPELIVSKSIGLGEVRLDGETVYWLEVRPEEQGRYVVVRLDPDGKPRDVNPAPFNARTRVHEYGGGSYCADEGVVYFSNYRDQRLYCVTSREPPRPVTPEGPYRYADAVVDRTRARLLCVREDHSTAGQEPVNTLVGVSIADGRVEVLVSGADFYSCPRLSPDARHLAWVSWNHPNMPWDGTDLWVAALDEHGRPGEATHVAGGPGESVLQPEWSPDGTLYFVSDRSGWWNLHRWREDHAQTVVSMDAEFAEPPWAFGDSSYAFESPRRIICAYGQDCVQRLAAIDTENGELRSIDVPFTTIGYVRALPGKVFFLGASPTEFNAVTQLDLSSGESQLLRRASDVALDPGYVSVAEPMEYPTADGLTAHGFFYRPRNRDFEAPAQERPPLLVMIHGGPTGAHDGALKLGIQYWTSRGIAVLDVNYGGSSGYGREYRQRLEGRWGIVDVDDCGYGARHLADQGAVDPGRLAIRGGSAGGFTTLAALTFRDTFKAGASHYGVSDLEALTRDTHKFESRYLDRLIGPYPERADIYRERSPIHAVDRLSCPIIFFQGLEDQVVPPNQAQEMVEALRRKGLPVAYLAFEGEQHGFRRAETIRRVLEAELYFYSRIFGFVPADPVAPVQIMNAQPDVSTPAGGS